MSRRLRRKVFFVHTMPLHAVLIHCMGVQMCERVQLCLESLFVVFAVCLTPMLRAELERTWEMRTVFVGRGYDVIFSLNTASVVHAPKVALFSLRQLLGTVFRERALRSASETICAKARENTVNFFLFFQVMPSGVKYYGSYCCAAWCNNGRIGRERGTKWFRIPRDDR